MKINLNGTSSEFQDVLTVDGLLENLKIEPFDLRGIKMPVTRLDSMVVDLKIGRRVEIKRGNFVGDFEGEVSGSFVPQPNNPGRTALRLRIKGKVWTSWLNGLGALRIIVQEYLKGERLNLSVQGSLTRPLIRKLNR